MKVPRIKVDSKLYGGLYKEDHGYIFNFPGTGPDTKMNRFTWYRKNNGWIVTGDQFDKKLKNLEDLSITVSFMHR